MSKFSYFRERVGVNSSTPESDFIGKSKSTREATLLRTGNEQTVVMTNAYREGGDEFILFSYILPSEENLQIGDVVENEGVKSLIISKYNTPLRNSFNKFQIVECKHTLGINDTIIPAYYAASVRSAVGEKLVSADALVAFDALKPMVIMAKNDLKVDTRFLLSGQAFTIKQVDDLTNPGIMYCSVEPSYVSVDDDIDSGIAYEIEAEEFNIDVNQACAGATLIETTIEAYFIADTKVDIVEKTLTEVKFTVPYGVQEFSYHTKNSNGEIITTTLEVV